MEPLATLTIALLGAQLQLASLQLQQMQPTAEASVMTTQDYVQYAETDALKYGLNDREFLGTLQCESDFNPDAIGDHGTSFGVAQVHLPAHPDITKEEALDGAWSIDWAAQQFAEGNQDIWSCYKKLYEKS